MALHTTVLVASSSTRAAPEELFNHPLPWLRGRHGDRCQCWLPTEGRKKADRNRTEQSGRGRTGGVRAAEGIKGLKPWS